MSDDDDVLTNVLSSRRIPHARSRDHQRGGGKKGKGGRGSDVPFDPLRVIGHYEVRLGSGRKHTNRHGSDDSKPPSWLEVHELTKDEHGLVGTLNLDSGRGRIQGMCVIAGSRKDLARIVDHLRREEGGSEEEEAEAAAAAEGENKSEASNEESNIESDGNIKEAAAADSTTNMNRNIESDQSSNDEISMETSMETSDRKLNTRINSFRKNSFRNPKFWLQWKGHVEHTFQLASASASQPQPQPPALVYPTPTTTTQHSSSNTSTTSTTTTTTTDKPTQPEPDPQQGYLVFVSNSCDRFDGTISCPALGWDNLKMTGTKTRPHGTPCAVKWKEFD